ncbi:uncharacterized protein TNIN_25101 [Trichonephila inaurata madagascariensis]|uniref:Endoplasmic reticulum lectin 1 n=1 Tax=Trichonephila inaurata madagascariensis TaxID=2747483 RepID=A0A8X6Y663_9ARAC|nr:uncharacterized protein TNIN_25101 [Trichonephila inaurata madagascariensis]
MKKLLTIILSYAIYCTLITHIEGAEYVEVPFQKYGVVFSHEHESENCGEKLPMVLFNKTFMCCLPSGREPLFKENYIYSDVNVFAEKVNNMPCLMKKQGDLRYVVCSHIIFQIHSYRNTYFSLGLRQSDRFVKKKLQGFMENGEQTYLVRHFTNGSVCGSFGEQIETDVRYVCRQSKEETIFSVQLITPCKYEIYIYSPRICLGINFESSTGYSIKCSSKLDAMALVLAEADETLPAKHSQYFKFEAMTPKTLGGDIFFVSGASMEPIEPHIYNKVDPSFKKELCENKLDYRAEEIMSATMGIPYNFSVDPQDKFEGIRFINLNDLMDLKNSTENHKSAFSDSFHLQKFVEKLMKNTTKKKKKN